MAQTRRIPHVRNNYPLPVFYLTREGAGLCVRPHRYALAIVSGVVVAGVLGLHECDNPVCVKAAAATDPYQHVVSGSQGDNMDRMARMRRGGGRYAVRRFDSRGIRQERSVALREAARHGWRCGSGADGAAWRPSHAVVTYASAHWGRCAWDRVGELGGLARGVATPSWRR